MDWTDNNYAPRWLLLFAILLTCALPVPDVGAATTVPNSAPIVANFPLTSVNAGNTYNYTPVATDANGDVLSFSIANKPAWATFNTTTGKLSGTPTNANAGTTTGIVITVSDGKTTTTVGPFSVAVVYVNHAPIVAVLNLTMSVNADGIFSYTPMVWDQDGDVLSFSITNKPAWATFNTTTGKLSGTPTNANAGTTTGIVITVSDGKTATRVGPFSVAVVYVNHAPIGAVLNRVMSVNADDIFSYTPMMAWDQDGDVLSFSITNKPPWATFNTTTGKLTGTPTNANAGTTTGIVITVSDGKAKTMFGPFTITVVPVNHAPIGAVLNRAMSVNADDIFSYTPMMAWDQDGDVLSFSITNKPAWATFNTATGKLSGTPTSANAGTTTGVFIAVSDGKAKTTFGPFTITVVPVNHAPVVTNFPLTSVNAGNTYNYTPAATDADGNVLSFSITNKPAWATFNTTTGKLSGTPTSANTGTTTGVVIAVSDGKTATAVGPFNIAVTNTNSGTATLSWTAPTTRQDGSPFSLSQLAGYHVYKGMVATSLSLAVNIANPTARSYTVSNLAPGTQYFTITAYDTTGAESHFANIVSKVIK